MSILDHRLNEFDIYLLHWYYFEYMLDDQDIKKIGDIIDEKVRPIVKAEIKASEDRIIVAVGEMLEQNVLPTIDTLGVRLDDMGVRLDDMQKTISNLPNKDYLDAKLADREGDTVVRQKEQNQKVNLAIDFLGKKKVLGEQELQQQNAIQVFPSPSPSVA